MALGLQPCRMCMYRSADLVENVLELEGLLQNPWGLLR